MRRILVHWLGRDRRISPLERFGLGLHRTSVKLPGLRGSELVHYYPLAESPLAYLAFANLGQVVLATYRSKFLTERTLDLDIPETFGTAAGLLIST